MHFYVFDTHCSSFCPYPLKIREINTFLIFHGAVSRSQEDTSKNSTPGQALHREMAS